MLNPILDKPVSQRAVHKPGNQPYTLRQPGESGEVLDRPQYSLLCDPGKVRHCHTLAASRYTDAQHRAVYKGAVAAAEENFKTAHALTYVAPPA